MRIGYARTSTTDQQAGFEAQVRDLEAVGCEKVYQEQASSVGARDELAVALDFVREGDTLVVTKLDRLARSTRHLNDIVDCLREKGSHLQILDLGIDTATPTGELVLTVMEIDGVEAVRVHLAKAERSVFVREDVDPSASVMVRMARGRQLTDSQVTAITNLVAASVPGLGTDAVKIVDQQICLQPGLVVARARETVSVTTATALMVIAT